MFEWKFILQESYDLSVVHNCFGGSRITRAGFYHLRDTGPTQLRSEVVVGFNLMLTKKVPDGASRKIHFLFIRFCAHWQRQNFAADLARLIQISSAKIQTPMQPYWFRPMH